ncbi:hypothetical protein PG994_006641 [Apiospora phragmitis]|uniref:Uncharacterized protein n=1 Tax=Apiospora phragmitis TaxID=2905665 RepID=A0ABR1VIG5_9PEZI
MAAAQPEVCPVVGTTNSTLPPSHPDIDMSKPGQTCPVVGAKTEHHSSLHKHPNKPDAGKCPVITNKTVNEAKSQAMDDKVCPVVGSVTTILPPDHPATAGKGDDAECPVTKAKLGHHKDKVTEHPSVANAAPGAVCPVVGHA